MTLAIDIGNTRTKGAVFEKDVFLEGFACASGELENTLVSFLKKYPEVRNIVLASVGKTEKIDLAGVKNPPKVHYIDRNSALPFVNKYSTQETLGIDRMVLASGSVLQFPKQNRLVIDAGTCVTYDFTNADDEYLGGAISPGLQLRYKSLNDYTAKLPLLSTNDPKGLIGDSTAHSIHSGVVNGLVHEIDGFIDSYRVQFPNFTIILTGGDGEFLAKRLKNIIFANPNFLLESLNRTFQYILND